MTYRVEKKEILYFFLRFNIIISSHINDIFHEVCSRVAWYSKNRFTVQRMTKWSHALCGSRSSSEFDVPFTKESVLAFIRNPRMMQMIHREFQEALYGEEGGRGEADRDLNSISDRGKGKRGPPLAARCCCCCYCRRCIAPCLTSLTASRDAGLSCSREPFARATFRTREYARS